MNTTAKSKKTRHLSIFIPAYQAFNGDNVTRQVRRGIQKQSGLVNARTSDMAR